MKLEDRNKETNKEGRKTCFGLNPLHRPSLSRRWTPILRSPGPFLACLWFMPTAWWDPRASVPTIVGADSSIWRVGPLSQTSPQSRVRG
jgi:hypothetical protein